MTEKHAPDPNAEFVPDEPDDPEAPSARRRSDVFEAGRMVGETTGPGVQLDDRVLEALAAVMADGGGGPSTVPAGFTYLGQFIAHDLSFERVTVAPGVARVGPVVQQRSPTLDLDSLYGTGFDSDRLAWAADHVKLRLGATAPAAGLPSKPGLDLPRDENGQAVIPDTRNDENLAVAQTHVAFLRFHNIVADKLAAIPEARDRFDQVRATVKQHYHSIVWDDFLPQICDAATIAEVKLNGRKLFEKEASAGDGSMPKLPIEFSVAAFRFGHSMLRTNYNWNAAMDDGAATLDRLFELTANGGDLKAGIPTTAVADFRRLYDFGGDGHAGLGDADTPGFNFAMRIDTALNARLGALPPKTFTQPGQTASTDPNMANLAFRDMGRARGQSLATGQRMVEFLQEREVEVEPLTKQQLRDGNGGARLNRLKPADVDAIVTHTPLWFYILREAEVNGGRLWGVGARIVVEVIDRAIQASSKPPPNTSGPTLTLAAGQSFRMTDLLTKAFTQEHLENPLGP